MPRITLILIGVLVLAMVGGGVWYWMNRDTITAGPDQTTNTATTTNTAVTNTNTAANINYSLPNEVKGDKAFSAKATVADVILTFSSVSKVVTFEGDQAPDKQVFVVVYFDGVDATKVLTVKDGLTNNQRLVTNKGKATEAGMKVASSKYQGDRGYLKYLVPSDASSFSLEIGPVENPQRITLPL